MALVSVVVYFRIDVFAVRRFFLCSLIDIILQTFSAIKGHLN